MSTYWGLASLCLPIAWYPELYRQPSAHVLALAGETESFVGSTTTGWAWFWKRPKCYLLLLSVDGLAQHPSVPWLRATELTSLC